MGWVRVNEGYILGAMPSELGPVYSGWVSAHPGKAGRLGEIAGSVIADFRAGLGANPTVVMDPEGDALPERCVKHCLVIVFYHLALEMGVSVNMSAQTAFINAEVYMRQLYLRTNVVERGFAGANPSYRADAMRRLRWAGCEAVPGGTG